MPKPLDYAELEKAANAAMNDIEQCEGLLEEKEIILAAFQVIAKRAFNQAARRRAYSDPLMIGDPPTLLSDALAALDAPVSDTPKQHTVLLTDAEVLQRLPVIISTASGKKLSEDELKAIIGKIRWA
ncbi:MAG: hypothetical protein KAV00_01945 [Phycisphaerae bacterium]|nr:hypothetical protein [Phycisphaerae bacterium]